MPIHPQADAPIMALASLLLVVVGLVLAIACSNLATSLLVRGATRAKEISLRLAIGATRRQLVRHLPATLLPGLPMEANGVLIVVDGGSGQFEPHECRTASGCTWSSTAVLLSR